MKRNKLKMNKKFIIIIFFIMLFISVGYATLTKVLNVQFSNVTVAAFNVIQYSWEVIGSSNDNYTNCGNISQNGSTGVYVLNVTLFPGSSCDYKIVYSNTASLTVKISEITPHYPSNLTCSQASAGYFGCDVPGGNSGSRLRYRISPDSSFSSTITTSNFTITPQSSKTVYLRIWNNATSLSTDTTVSGGGFDLTFSPT